MDGWILKVTVVHKVYLFTKSLINDFFGPKWDICVKPTHVQLLISTKWNKDF